MAFIQHTHRKLLISIIAAMFLFIVLRWFHPVLYSIYNEDNYVALHTILEFFSILVSFTISIYGWKAFQHHPSMTFLWVPILFSVVGLLDLLHTLTYEGMPFLFTEASIAKATWFWVVARLTESIAMLYLINIYNRPAGKERRWKYVIAAFAFTVLVIATIYTFEQQLPALVIEGQGTTVLKNSIEYLICLMHMIAAIVSYRQFLKCRSMFEMNLTLAFVCLFFSEIIFTWYTSIYDFDVFVGHLFKVLGYVFILKGCFFSKIQLAFLHHSETEKHLRTAANLADTFFHNSPDSIKILDPDGVILKVNPGFEQIYGWTEAEVVGKKVSDLMPKMSEAIEQELRRVLAGETLSHYETHRMTKSEQKVCVSITMSPIRNEAGEVYSISAYSRDITRLKMTEELLQKSEKLAVVGELAAGVAHEIRNPLTTLKGFTQLFAANQTALRQEYIDTMLSELDRIETITNEFMALAKPQSTVFQSANLRTLLEQVIQLLNPQALLSNVVITFGYYDKHEYIHCDGNQLKQVFINIIKNAVEAMPEGGKLLIEVNPAQSDHVLIRIHDTGCGIPENVLPHLGEPFYSLKSKGTGLGLTVSSRIIEAHRGNVVFKSVVNQGTTVEIMLPIKPCEVNTGIR